MYNKTILLASKSPRRKDILSESGLEFKVVSIDAEESFPEHLDKYKVAEYIALKKAKAFSGNLADQEILLTADTIVLHKGVILGKPSNRQEAISMLQAMSDDTHEVVTGVVLKSKEKEVYFSVISKVKVAPCSMEEIVFYVDNYQPMDKAGAYGIQEWFGTCKIKSIEGSYLNIVGLPMQQVYDHLTGF